MNTRLLAHTHAQQACAFCVVTFVRRSNTIQRFDLSLRDIDQLLDKIGSVVESILDDRKVRRSVQPKYAHGRVHEQHVRAAHEQVNSDLRPRRKAAFTYTQSFCVRRKQGLTDAVPDAVHKALCVCVCVCACSLPPGARYS